MNPCLILTVMKQRAIASMASGTGGKDKWWGKIKMTENNNGSEKDTDGWRDGWHYEGHWGPGSRVPVEQNKNACPFWSFHKWGKWFIHFSAGSEMSPSFQMETLKHPSHYNPFPLHMHSSKKRPSGFPEADRQLEDIQEKSPQPQVQGWKLPLVFPAIKSTHSYANTPRVTTQLRTWKEGSPEKTEPSSQLCPQHVQVRGRQSWIRVR